VRDIGVVRGYCAEAITTGGVRFFDNPRYLETGEVASLACAMGMLDQDVVIAYGDLVLRQHLLHELLCADAPITVLVDPRLPAQRGSRVPRDAVSATRPPPLPFDEQPVYLRRMGPALPAASVHGCYMGLMRVRRAGSSAFRRALARVLSRPRGEQCELHAVLNELVLEAPEAVRVLYVQGDWMDINGLLDLARSQG
jgi:phosphoenolpyruvate phosphomutase